MTTHHDATDHPLTDGAIAGIWTKYTSRFSTLANIAHMPGSTKVTAMLRAAFDAGREYERGPLVLPTDPGTAIVPADGHEYITATVFGETYRAREAILIGKTQWHAAWRSDTSVLIYVSPEHITPGPWKVDNR